ncbi:SIMPL domain-containing protein [Candidatus Falkowbacteria bacterium]|nr:SIMPL domain-containing protein [Candidatus Falkowbacteria bacterium]
MHEDLKNNPTHHKVFGVLKAVLMLVLIILLIGLTRNQFKSHAYIGRTNDSTHQITISAEGKVTAIPDIATFNIGIITENKDVAIAQKENTEKMNAIIEELKKLDVDKEDIKTTVYNIYPRYNYNQGRQTLRGYEVNQSVQVKIRDLDKVGETIGKAGDLGANNVSGLNFTIDEPETLRQQAREQALKKAKEKAESLAKVAGVKLGKLVTFSESGSPSAYPLYGLDFAESDSVGRGGGSPEIESGSLDITVTVSVSYEVL